MRLHLSRRMLAVLFAGTLLLLPLAASAAVSSVPRQPEEPCLTPFSLVLKFLFTPFVRLWEKAGCEIDPSGKCATSPVVQAPNAGCEIDPSGKCAPGQ
jgi:hypothetical protein